MKRHWLYRACFRAAFCGYTFSSLLWMQRLRLPVHEISLICHKILFHHDFKNIAWSLVWILALVALLFALSDSHKIPSDYLFFCSNFFSHSCNLDTVCCDCDPDDFLRSSPYVFRNKGFITYASIHTSNIVQDLDRGMTLKSMRWWWDTVKLLLASVEIYGGCVDVEW